MADLIKFYEKHFDPKKYVETYYSSDDGDKLKEWYIDFLHRLFSQGKLTGDTLLDVGCGPTIQSVMSASLYIRDIYMSDILEKNRSEVKKWLNEDIDAIDHSLQLKHLAMLEGHNDYKEIEQRIRKAVKEVLPCNILNENPLDPKKMKFDIVVSSLCVDAYPDREDYFQAYKNISSLVRQGGYVVFQESLNATFYKVGEVDFPATKKDGATVQLAIEEANIKILEVVENKYKEDNILPSDLDGFINVFGVKM